MLNYTEKIKGQFVPLTNLNLLYLEIIPLPTPKYKATQVQMTDEKSQPHYFPWTFSLKQDEVVWVAFEMCYFTISKHTLWLIGHVAPHQTSVINRAESWEKRSVLINSPGSAYIAGLHGKWAAVWMNGNRQRLLDSAKKPAWACKKKKKKKLWLSGLTEKTLHSKQCGPVTYGFSRSAI